MKRRIRYLILAIFMFVLFLIGYTIWDNNRIIVTEEEVLIKDLPQELEGFTILQISDLHEKEFGKNQKKLIELVNSLQYDSLVITGDLLADQNSLNYDPIYMLFEGIRNKEHALFVPGNTDPVKSFNVRKNRSEKHEFIQGLESRGIKLLDSNYSITKGGSKVYFVDFKKSLQAENNKSEIGGIEALQLARNDMSILNNLTEQDVLIGLTHYPIVDIQIDQIKANPNMKFHNFDLIMAGHYHGGQIRLPFLGALFVPEPYYKHGGLFPPSDRVKGLWEYRQTKQYVSAGLGSSKAISFLGFRLFNTPEINLISFKNRGE
ncbi:metallophosphoesterase [Virgibacillus sp. 6R]|uniref:metallophosphoesterase n=1 Tax=Metabacillus sp. 22489 TaxID=3453928 RepID=UPI00119ED616